MGLLVSLFALVGLSSNYTRAHDALNRKTAAVYACEAGLESLRAGAATSRYDNRGNIFLYELSQIAGRPAMSWTLDSQTRVDVQVERRTPAGSLEPFYRVTATGWAAGMRAQMLMDVRERDTFSKYLFFIDQDDISFGSTTLNGLVHSNRSVIFTSPGAVAEEFVSAVNGVIDPQHCAFVKGYDGKAAAVPLPSFSALSSLQPQALPPFSFGPGADVQIEFTGNAGKVKIWNHGTLVTPPQGTDLPANQLIFVDGNISGMKGDIYGRLTVACTGQVQLTGSIRYVDQDGDPMYKLVNKISNTTVTDEQSTGAGVVWDGTTYDYVLNDTDSYGSHKYDPAVPSVLGIMANNDVLVTKTADNYNMVFHCALFSANGARKADLSGKFGNWRYVGSNVSKLGGYRYSSGTRHGWGLSGSYIYDSALRWNPPPHWMLIDKPVFGQAWRVN
jgi:hypothetical protein